MKTFAVIFCIILFALGAESFDAVKDVRYLLVTRRNIAVPQQLIWGNVDSIKNSSFDPNTPTRIIIHGFLEGQNSISGLDTETVRALLNAYDFNVIYVDWSAGAQTINYIAARRRIRTVGPTLATFIDLMHNNKLLDISQLKIIGFSLGAHAAGLAGKEVRAGKVHTIIGLDPAGPLFEVDVPYDRLAVGDAEHVECIHTNGGILGIGFGIGAPICDANFFPNGGSTQSGCLTNTCSHLRAVDLFIESLLKNQFWANQCESTSRMSRSNCRGQPGAFMGGEPANFGLKGIFYLETNRRAPFGQGKW